ncbi:MAG: hypothetical protein V4459_11585 [Pseudomonadota bacterium]
MKHLLAVALATGVAVLSLSPAEASGGCGRGFHRGAYGRCVVNRPVGPVIAVRPAPVIGVFYSGRGYWDGSRYWQHRYRWHRGWRYR